MKVKVTIIDNDIAATEALVPEEVRADLWRMAEIQSNIHKRIHEGKAISPVDVEEYNRLCYKHFGKIQDGGEFIKEEKQPQNSFTIKAGGGVSVKPPLRMEDAYERMKEVIRREHNGLQ